MKTATATEKKERPISFKSEMVRAILEGRKSMTRRIMKPQPKYDSKTGNWVVSVKEKGECLNYTAQFYPNPYGRVGDLLYVKETYRRDDYNENEFIYKADIPQDILDEVKGIAKWKSSRFMPKIASRLKLEITKVRVERIQDISIQDIKAEGIKLCSEPSEHSEGLGLAHYDKVEFANLWAKINGAAAWNDNPFVWVIEFKKV